MTGHQPGEMPKSLEYVMSNNNTNTNADNRDPIGKFDFYVSDRIAELAKANERQAQLTVSHAMLGSLLEAANMDPETVLSRRRGVGLQLEVRTPKGNVIPLLMADTHAIWFSHQRDKSAQTLVKYFAQAGGGAELDLISVQGVNLTTSTRKKTVSVEDCPV